MSQVEKFDQKTVTTYNFYVCLEHDGILYMEKLSIQSHAKEKRGKIWSKITTRKKHLYFVIALERSLLRRNRRNVFSVKIILGTTNTFTSSKYAPSIHVSSKAEFSHLLQSLVETKSYTFSYRILHVEMTTIFYIVVAKLILLLSLLFNHLI